MKLFDIQISAGFYLGAAASILLLPWDVLFAFVLSAAIHELCHLTALYVSGVTVRQVKLGLWGAEILTGVMCPGQELICTAAGPIGSLSLLLTARWTPLLALFGLVQGVFNLLPIYPLDGGRVIRSIFVLAKTARCDYNSPDYEQRGIYHDRTDSADSACSTETGPVYRRRI